MRMSKAVMATSIPGVVQGLHTFVVIAICLEVILL